MTEMKCRGCGNVHNSAVFCKCGYGIEKNEDHVNSPPHYKELRRVLDMAFEQASSGKGKERHAKGEPFEEQTIMQIIKAHGVGFATGQGEKKLREHHGLSTDDAKIHELLGVINYTAAAILYYDKRQER